MIDKNSVHKSAMDIIKQRNLVAKQNASVILEKALANSEFNKLYYSVRTLQFEISKPNISKQNFETLSKQILDQKSKLTDITYKLGLSPHSFKPQHSCKKCGDTGLFGGKHCDCYTKIITQIYLDICGVSEQLPSFKNVKFDVFTKNTETIKQIYKTTEDFVTSDTKKQNLVICGKPGVGKTYLSKCALSHAIDNNIFSIYYTATSLNQLFLSYHLAKLNEKQNIISPILNCDLLIIDDLGSENNLNNVTNELMYMVLESRLSSGKKTLITTNNSPEEIQNVYEDRVFSRIFNKLAGIVLNFDGNNLRFKK